ncbi:MAG: tRNA guanosine(34) transglycosylase Tgt [Caldilineaceae bacterium]|nr:tRNA guanosine(34) transglycosylase Tgt [Caldilineaceae bacterium]
MLDCLTLPHGVLQLPAFLPDATLGVVRGVDSADLEAVGVQAVVMNTFHLMQHPGSSTIQALGGLHAMSGWPHPIVTDSGGFQAYSLIRQNARYGTLTNDGIVVKPDGANRKFQLTPEKCVQLQVSYGADVVMCLDDCTHVDDPPEVQQLSVQRTVAWAKRCRAEFDRLMEQKQLAPPDRPLLFAVVQGGGSPDLRRACADALLAIGFDGYGFGGWPLDAEGQLVDEMLAYTRELIPAHQPMHGLGIGHPANVTASIQLGYTIFDCALPTRDARRGRLYAYAGEGQPTTRHNEWFRFLYIGDDKYIKDPRPLDETCDCLACRRYSRGYLRHLLRANETAFQRLATIHNLRFMARLMAQLGR